MKAVSLHVDEGDIIEPIHDNLPANVHHEPKRVAHYYFVLPKKDNEYLGGEVISMLYNRLSYVVEQGTGAELPASLDTPTFEFQEAGFYLSWEWINEGQEQYFARIHYPDAAVPGRIWDVEYEVRVHDHEVSVSALRMVREKMNAGMPHDLIPGLDRMMTNFALEDAGVLITPKPWVLTDDLEVQRYVDYLLHPSRRLPIIAVSAEPNGPYDDVWLDTEGMARRAVGLATVVVIPSRMTFAVTDLIGREWSVFGGAVRLYHAPLDPARDLHRDHPLTLPTKITSWTYNGRRGRDQFADFLYHSVARRGVDKYKILHEGLDAIRRRLNTGESARSESASERLSQRLGWAMKEIELLRNSLRTSVTVESISQSLSASEHRELDFLRTAVRDLERENRRLDGYVRASIDDNGGMFVVPTSLPAFEEWWRRSLRDTIVVHPQALRGVADSDYEDPRLVFEVVDMLAHEYTDMMSHSSDQEYVNRFRRRCEVLGVDLFPTVDDYDAHGVEPRSVEWPVGSGNHYDLEYCVGKGRSADSKHTLRVYIAWSEVDKKCIIGWLPSLLPSHKL